MRVCEITVVVILLIVVWFLGTYNHLMSLKSNPKVKEIYNKKLDKFPTSIVAALCNFKKRRK